MNALVISNPTSGTHETMLGEVIATVESLYSEIQILKTASEGDAYRFAKASGGYDHLLVIGGDGTLHEVVNGLMQVDYEDRPKIGLIPGGTCNDFARALDLPVEPVEAARILKMSHAEPVDVMRVNDRYGLNFIGVGLIADASRQIDPLQKESLGSIGYFLATIRQFREADPFDLQIEQDGKIVHEGPVSFLYIGNGAYLGTVPTKLQTQSFNDGFVEVVHSSAIGFPMIRQLLAQQFGLEQASDEWVHLQMNNLIVRLRDTQIIDVDGEHFEANELQIAVLPRELTFLVAGEA
ncbi:MULTISPECIES: diacylglycerol/lipid kinase family protein [Exiguobacterium]|uniref:diacylglycerol/lipid kinase family protein n=1 Tax=Exiguobacterium TaxID=33986 RepID=UPI001BE9A0B3|nr:MULTISPECIES: diacylglycerol kinase family protein [Exiguobacterium]MCT4782016.1 diacylglycerol kinase family lipid kinase [Exiguobacterium himgiriensis]